MADFSRYLIRDGDTTTAGGTVLGTGTHMPVYGAYAALEGDSIQCPTCNSMGVIRCVPPIRRATGHANRQFSLDGDLCICNCPSPPRLIASQRQFSMGFSADEMLGMPGIAGWLSHAGLSMEAFGHHHDEQFQLLGSDGKPLARRRYRAVSASGVVVTGVTDAAGKTQRIATPAADTVNLYLIA